MKLKVSVSFEYDLRPVETFKTVVSASQVGTCVRRAVEEAQKAVRPHSWRSLVVCVLERLDEPETETSSEGDESVESAPFVNLEEL